MDRRRHISIKGLLLFLSLAAIVISLFFVLRYNKKLSYESSFVELVENENYQEALALYREIQINATDSSNSKAERERYADIKKQYEAYIAAKTEQIIQRLKKGDSLNDFDCNYIASMEEITGALIVPFLNEATEDYLDQKINQMQWKHFLSAFDGFPNLQTNVANILSQEAALTLAAEKFAAVEAKDMKEEWHTIWQDWEALTEDEEIGRFARNYAAYRLSVFQEEIYAILLQDIDAYLFAGKYYSAKLLLDHLFDAFPNETEVQEKLQICHDKLPDRLIEWTDPVENIGVRPLVADTARAKSGAYQVFAETGMVTPQEFAGLLQELYENDYVLVSQSLFHDYPDDYSKVIIPEGKKPLVLILEQYQYSTRYVAAGSIEQLTYTPEENQFHGLLQANQPDSEMTLSDPVLILEDFLTDHADFSFDGAKAMLALNVDENILGYMINEQQLAQVNAKREALQLEPHVLTEKSPTDKDKFYGLQLADLKNLLQGLQKNGYQFANATYSDQDLQALSLKDFKEEITAWQDIMQPLIGSVDGFLFPAGAHVYDEREKINFLTEAGYCNFYSENPSVYNFYGETYLHFNFFPFNGNSVLHAEEWGFSRFGNAANIGRNWRD